MWVRRLPEPVVIAAVGLLGAVLRQAP